MSASELNAISDSIVNVEGKIENINNLENYKVGDVFITSRTDLDETWQLANGDAIYDNTSDIYKNQNKAWIPLQNIIKVDRYTATMNGFCSNGALYILYYLGTNGTDLSICIQKRVNNSITDNKKLFDAPGLYYSVLQQNDIYYNTYAYIENKWIWVIPMYQKSGSKNKFYLYVIYTEDLEDFNQYKYTKVGMLDEDGTSSVYLSIEYINNTYIITTQYNMNSLQIIPLYIYYSTDLATWNKKKIVPNIQGANYTTSITVAYFDNQYHIYAQAGGKKYTCSASTLDGLSENMTEFTDNNIFVLNKAPFQISEDTFFYKDNNTIRWINFKHNTTGQSNSAYFSNSINFTNFQNYVVAVGYQSNMSRMWCARKAYDEENGWSLEPIIDEEGINGCICGYFYGYPCEAVVYTLGSNIYFSTTSLPEISLSNTYTYVKTSSTPTS